MMVIMIDDFSVFLLYRKMKRGEAKVCQNEIILLILIIWVMCIYIKLLIINRQI